MGSKTLFRRTETVLKRAAALIVVALAAIIGLWRVSRLRTWQIFGTIVPRVETGQKLVALTFDDGPVGYSADEILKSLGGTKATFFVCGAEIRSNPAVLPRIIGAGHEIGNHTWSHDRLVLKSPGYIARQIESTDEVIRQAGWRGPILFRAPYCKKLVALPWYLWRHGRVHVTWDVDPESDARIDKHADRIVADVVTRTRPGSIILLHPWYHGREATRQAIPLIISDLQGRGYRFVTVSELLRQRR